MAFMAATACTISDIDDTPVNIVGSKGQLQVVGRITQFSDCDVATRSKKDGDEPKVTSMGLALFPIDGNTIGDCVYYDYEQGSNIVFIVERSDEIFNNSTDKQFAMYIFANMQDAEGFPITDEAGKGKPFAYFNDCAVSTTTNVADVPENGFPMVGSIGNTTNSIDADGIEFILKPTASSPDNPDGLPKLDGIATDNLEISMKALFAKFTFTIAVRPDQEIVGNKAPRFDLLSYEVHNIASTVDSDSSTNNATVLETSGEVSQNSYAQGATTTTFDFYLPERYLTPAQGIDDVLPTELKKGTYDTVVDKDQDGYRDQDEKYHQRFKNLLPGDDQKATHVTINGKFTDHQGHTYDVAYNIYLGGNNYDNFDIIRNTHYDNSVTIRGISSSDDQATNEDAISIDWRVNVERSTPLVINLRRESLLDAHFEVRPLRLRLVGENIPTGTSATVTILNEDGTTNNLPGWIRLEKSGTGNDYIASGVSTGKRKYFTTDLVTNTLKDGTSITLDNLTADNQTLWIYVDENTDTKSRAAIVRVSHQGLDTDYKIVQNGLFEVKSPDGERTYYIEQYEEYLYNYDAEDDYGQTDYEGMEWGLEDTQLSYDHRAMYVEEKSFSILGIDIGSAFTGIVNNLLASSSPFYDFYLPGDTDLDVITHQYAGHEFCKEIIEVVNTTGDELNLSQTPRSAVEYCYNRNKRNADGTVASVNWYLPAVDEIEEIMMGAYADFLVFQDQFYWSCQPAYDRVFVWYDNIITRKGEYMRDNKAYARATKANYLGNNQYEPIYSTMIDYAFYTEIEYSGGTWDLLDSSKYSAPEFPVPDEGITLGGNKVNKASVESGYQPRTEKNRIRCVRKVN